MKKDGKTLLEQAKKAKQKPVAKNFDKLVGKKKNSDRFGKVNFNG